VVVAFSPDGKTVLTGSLDGTARLSDAATGRPLAEPLRHDGEVRSVAFSPDGKQILTGSEDRSARLWDPATGKPACPPLTHQRGVRSIAFSPDGHTVLTGSLDGTACFWDVSTGQPLGAPLRSPLHEVLAVAFSPDGNRVAVGTSHLYTRVCPVPVPVAGDVERVVRWTEVLTGLELDEAGVAGALDAADWQERCRRLGELGGPPLP
jgi:WD40 repeat protein